LAGSGVCLFAGYVLSVMTMRVGEISFVTPFRYTILIWAIILGMIVFGDYPDGWTILGIGVIVATGIFTIYRERMLSWRSKQPVTTAFTKPGAGTGA
jgi:drug/metabolite transporter (DMT)-like permease